MAKIETPQPVRGTQSLLGEEADRFHEVVAAFDRVGDIRSPEAIPQMWPLVQDGSDANQRVRWRAAEMILAIGGREVVREFFERLPVAEAIKYEPEELEGYATRMSQMTPPPTELVVRDLTEGTGDVIPEGATVTMNYIGVSCSTGKIFDSSYGPGREPLEIPLSQVIPGWTQGVPGMKVGGQRLLVIPPDLGYGERGSGPTIAPGETLWFVVEAVAFQPAAAAP